MKTHFYSLTELRPPRFRDGVPSRHELLGGQIVLLVSSMDQAMSVFQDVTHRVVGIVCIPGQENSHQQLSPTLLQLVFTDTILPMLHEMLSPLLCMQQRLAQTDNHRRELELELSNQREKLQWTRANYDKSLGRITRMVNDIRIQKERLDNIIESTRIGTWEWNMAKKEFIPNARWAEIAGYRATELQPFSPDQWRNMVHSDDLARLQQALRQHIRGQTPFFSCEFRIRHRNGHWVWVLEQGKVLSQAPDGEPLMIYGTRQDITARHSAEETIARMNESLQTKNRELEQILYVASHDLRAPLVNVEGFSHELEETLEELQALELGNMSGQVQALLNDMRSSLDFVAHSARKMDSLLSGLLKLSRLGKEAMYIEPLNMNALVDSVMAECEFLIRDCAALVLREELPDCLGDAVAINQIFSNLISNAIKYRTPDQTPAIRISGSRSAAYAIFCVADNGIGIDPAHHKRIFEVFHRLNPGHYPGEGLGLAIVSQNLERLGGSIRVESQSGQGSRFFVTLPAASKDEVR